MKITVRKATEQDVPVLKRLIDASVRRLQAQDYTPRQIEGALESVFGVDSQLITDGTYLLAEAEDRTGSLTIIACGGWSRRKTLYGGDQWSAREDDLLDPKIDAAKVRAFFVHPDWARQGVGTMVLEACENAARAAGFTRFEMGATITGAKLFGTKGYVAVKNISVPLKNGESLPVVHMEKQA